MEIITMDIKTATPDITLEIHRYSKPENAFVFFHFMAEENVNRETLEATLGYKLSFWNHPFAKRELETGIEKIETEEQLAELEGPGYAEVGRSFENDESVEGIRNYLKAQNFKPMTLAEVPLSVGIWVIANQCPVEWQTPLTDTSHVVHEEIANRITIWMRER